MNKTRSGGPAFPRPIGSYGFGSIVYSEDQQGMSLRDWFAGQALAGMRLASDYRDGPCDQIAAARAYALADAMINQRNVRA